MISRIVKGQHLVLCNLEILRLGWAKNTIIMDDVQDPYALESNAMGGYTHIENL